MARDRLAAMRVRSIHIWLLIFIILIVNCGRRNRATALGRVSCHLFLLSQPNVIIFRDNSPTQASGGGRQPNNPYARQNTPPDIEMADVRNSKTRLTSTPPPGDMHAFYAEVCRRRCHILLF